MRASVVLTIYLCLATDSIAQTSAEVPAKMGFRVERGSVNGKPACITDPESKLDLVPFLRNKSIAEEIKLSEQKLTCLMNLLAKSKGSLSSPIYTQTFGRMGFTTKSFEEATPYFRELGRASVLEMAEHNREIVDAVLTESEINRLRQIVYQVELFRIGPCNALNEGYLGKRLGIENYQRSAIQIRSESVYRHLAESTIAVLKRTYLELGRLLSLDKAIELEKLVGEPFYFRDDTYSYTYYVTLPNPDSLLASASLVCNQSVAEELRVTEQERTSIEKYLRNQRGHLELPRVEPRINGQKRSKKELQTALELAHQENEAFINDILDPRQTDRLCQLGYQIEVARLGIAESLNKGFLGKKLQIDPNLVSQLCNKSERIFANAMEEINQLQLQARVDIFRELSPLQRQEVEKVLGKPFIFRDQVLE